MLSHWIFFVSLFLLPYSTHGWVVPDDDGDDCPKPIAEGGDSYYCFKLVLCNSILPPDNRLMPTRIIFTKRDEEGDVTEFVSSFDITPWMRKKIKKQQELGEKFEYIRFFVDFPGGLDESAKYINTLDEFTLYFGSDHAQMYGAPKYGYSATYLQLKREKNITFSSFVEYSIHSIEMWDGTEIIQTHTDPVQRISTPGIYSMKKGSKQVTEVTQDPVVSYNALRYHGDYCHQPFYYVSQTVYCFKLVMTESILPKDNRLLPTAISFLVVDNDGKIVERYENNYISSWVREKSEIQRELKSTFKYYTFQMLLPGNRVNSEEILDRTTDFILYFGSDHAQIYDRPDAVLDSDNLQLSEQPTDDLSRDFKYTINSIMKWNEAKMFDTNRLTISKPGIYRIRKGTNYATEMHYDPMVAKYTHMHLR